ncbi:MULTISPECIES: cytochrome-c peroxidase [unclassified Arenibacter]|uniref:cytochrome-c peroxidase n=1 Tax=unclassified Arenibacter TaxID=2615047 RepID=UPI000E3508E6|nr:MULTISPECIES: cytochrome c peroxidase [unclassified Arenibacter]MCM4164746.1 cytochrome-c peroxidase [Arenibacter sp. A80]RFT55816.1 cytochrome-c peroxidase [Arenibacter sp. P308M17]
MKKSRVILKVIVSGSILGILVLIILSGQSTTAYHPVPILQSNCPPGFKLNGNNECIAKNLYNQYAITNKAGVGGLKSALPEIRDGFSPKEIDLGRYLFFDPLLSADQTISCASCHDPNKGFSDGLATSRGKDGQRLKRAAPSLYNVGYLKKLFWDGRASTLEEQMLEPLFSKEEMGNTLENLLSTLNEIENYRTLFAEAYPNRHRDQPIALHEITKAITAFQSSLISLNSRYDQYAHGYDEALNKNEIEGLNVFRSFVARCAECHTPPLFTNQQFAVIGTPEPDNLPLDPGAEIPFKDKSLRGAFKVPSLRNIARTAPYMHSGRFKTLRETVQFYTDGRGHAVPEGEKLLIHWHIWEPNLTDYELDRLVDFLKTLTDESFTPKIPEVLPSGLKSST